MEDLLGRGDLAGGEAHPEGDLSQVFVHEVVKECIH